MKSQWSMLVMTLQINRFEKSYIHERQSSCPHHDLSHDHNSNQFPTAPCVPASPCSHLWCKLRRNYYMTKEMPLYRKVMGPPCGKTMALLWMYACLCKNVLEERLWLKHILTSSSRRKDGPWNVNISHEHPCVGLLYRQRQRGKEIFIFRCLNYAPHNRYLLPAVKYLLKMSGYTPVHGTCDICSPITARQKYISAQIRLFVVALSLLLHKELHKCFRDFETHRYCPPESTRYISSTVSFRAVSLVGL